MIGLVTVKQTFVNFAKPEYSVRGATLAMLNFNSSEGAC